MKLFEEEICRWNGAEARNALPVVTDAGILDPHDLLLLSEAYMLDPQELPLEEAKY